MAIAIVPSVKSKLVPTGSGAGAGALLGQSVDRGQVQCR